MLLEGCSMLRADVKALRLLGFWIVPSVMAVAIGACHRPAAPQPASDAPSALHAPTVETQAPSRQDASIPVRDLSGDESLGGHTLARHVGKTDAELARRLRREPQISSASTYTDRLTAERAVGAALAFSDAKVTAWQHRRGRRPNLVLHYVDRSRQTLGRSLARGQQASVPCTRVLVVLRWNERDDRFYVLTSYPEARP
jgi:hypothetical protein